MFLPSAGLAQTPEQQIDAAAKPFGGFKQSYGGAGGTGNQYYQDNVDPFTGTLQAQLKPIKIPGNGGLDISIGLAYRMEGLKNSGSSRLSASSSAMFEDSALSAGGWLLALAPKVAYKHIGNAGASLCTPGGGTSPFGFEKIFLESEDGRSERLFRTGAAQYESSTRWRLTCSGTTHILTSPLGVSYTLADRTAVSLPEGGSIVTWQTTRVTDLSGNYYDIAYAPLTVLNCLQTGASSMSLRVPSGITASDGRAVSFFYDSGTGSCAVNGRGARLTSIQAPGATWSFEYYGAASRSVVRFGSTITYTLTGQLRRLIAPDGTAYSFEYQDVCPTTNAAFTIILCGHQGLSKVTLPTGGFIGYEYRSHFDVNERGYSRYLECAPDDGSGCYWDSPQSGEDPGLWNGRIEASSHTFGQPDLLRRYTSDGGSWVYSYDRAIDKAAAPGTYDVTTIEGPAGRTVHRFIGLGYFTPAGLASFSRFTNVCNGYAVPAVPPSFCSTRYAGAWQVGLPVDVSIGSLSVESFAFLPRVLTTQDSQTVAGRVLLSDGAQVLVPDLQRKTSVVDGATYQTVYTNYDQYGNPGTVTETGPNGGSRTSTLTYHTDTTRWIVNLLKNESSTGRSVVRTFDTQGRLRSIATDGVTTSFTYDAQGNIETKTSPPNRLTTYQNYKRGIAQTELQPEATTLSRTVSDAGYVVSETDGEGRTVVYSRDGLGRVTGIDYARGADLVASYTATTRTVTRGPLVETTTFDGFGRDSSIVLGGITTSYGYDALGRKTFESNPGDTIGRRYQYDALDRIRRITNADDTYKERVYVAASVTETDERLHSTTYTFRGYGTPTDRLLMSITAADPQANVTLTRYPNGLLETITQAGVTRSFGYDGRNYLTSEVNPESGTTTYERNDANEITARIIGAVRTDYGYDDQGRLEGITYSDGTPAVTQTYWKTGRLRTVSSTRASRVLGYDENNNLTSEALTIGTTALTAIYGYNDNDQLASITYPISQRVVSYAPDPLGRPTLVSGYVSHVSYWPSGMMRDLQYVNGITTSYGQNERLWPGAFSTGRSGTYYVSSIYDYDDVGNLTSVVDSADAWMNRTLGYDALNRLTSAFGPWGSGSVGYDGAGNVLHQTFGSSTLGYSYDTQNRLGSVSGRRSASFSYDAAGNVTAAGTRAYTYDAVPNLTCIDCSRASKIEYTYDGLSKRVTAKSGTSTTYEFHSINGDLLVTYEPARASRLTEYIYLGGKRIAQRVSDQAPATPLNPIGTPAFRNQNGGVVLGVQVGGSSPTGSVAFSRNGVRLGAVQVNAGIACIEVMGLEGGVHSITAVYSGDANNSSSTLVYSLTVIDARPPAINVPASSITGNYVISWSAASGATVSAYELYESTSASFASQTLAYAGTNTSFAISGRGGGRYYYRVRGCIAQLCSDYRTGADGIFVAIPPSTPASISVPSGVNGTGSYTVGWGGASGTVTAYELYEANNPDFTGQVNVYSGTGASASITGRSEGQYYYRVRACNTSIACSDYRTAGSAVTVLFPPALPGNISLPTHALLGSTYTVSWGAAAGAVANYEVSFSTDPLFSNGAFAWTVTTNSTPASNSARGTYFYRVRACNAGGCSAYRTSSSGVLVLPQPATPTGLTAQLFSFCTWGVSWNAVTDATSYRVTDVQNAVYTTSSTSLSYLWYPSCPPPSGVSPNDKRPKWVRACNAVACSPDASF